MKREAISRVRYFDKQFLRVDEFRDEQQYQLALRRRHAVTAHSWGIVRGLELSVEDGAAVVSPGVAIDGYGRELLLPAKERVAPESFDNFATDRLDVWLVYERLDDGAAPAGYGDCRSASGGSPYRADEKPKVIVERATSNVVDARRPPGVPRDVRNAAVPLLSDDPADGWPVYLGRVLRLKGKISADAAHRPYAGVVAEEIDHPANPARVEIGGQSTKTRTVGGVPYEYQDADSRRFAVFVAEDPAKSTSLAPRLEILADETIRMRGQAIVEGNLRTAAGAVRFDGVVKSDMDELRSMPSIYRSTDSNGNALRIDLATVDGSPSRQFAIGFSKPDGTFVPCLSIALDSVTKTPVVTIHGDLRVDGKITGAFVGPAIAPDAMAALFASFSAGQMSNSE